ncbi:hypothetical protein PAEPH01_0486 [Pancytospora epiphaga]|nr:hypothetical protein PAEPH01_0486 [Pancytospora epiphaga]
MTRKVRVYAIKLPFTLKEWRKGSRYILTKLTTSEVQIVYHTMSHDEGCITTKTHKVLDVKNKVPYIIRKLIPDTACVVDEFSTNIDSVVLKVNDPSGNSATGQVYNIEAVIENNDGAIEHIDLKKEGVVKPENMGGIEEQLVNVDANEQGEKKLEKDITVKIKDEDGDKLKLSGKGSSGKENGQSVSEMSLNKLFNKCTTIYKNRCFDSNTFSLEVHTVGADEPHEKPFDLNTAYKTEWIDFRTYGKADLTKTGSRDYSGDWEKSFPTIIVYKCVDISVNKFGLGWVTSEVNKMIRGLLISVQQKIVESYEEWANLTEEEIKSLENEMIQKFILKIE